MPELFVIGLTLCCRETLLRSLEDCGTIVPLCLAYPEFAVVRGVGQIPVNETLRSREVGFSASGE